MSTTTIGVTPPSAPQAGDLWWDSNSAQTFIWYVDGTSAQWVISVNHPGGIPAGVAGAPGYSGDERGLESIYDAVQIQLPGLTTDVAAMAIWSSVETFYIKSTYRRELVSWVLNPGDNVLQFDPFDINWRVNRILDFRGLANFVIMPPGKVTDTSPSPPDSTRQGLALLVLKPGSLATELPYDVMSTYWETLVSGALHRLCLQPGKPYSDLNAAQIHGRLYRSGIASARADVQAGYVRDGSSWSYPYFATGGRANGRQGL